jgi:hypothetical protein
MNTFRSFGLMGLSILSLVCLALTAHAKNEDAPGLQRDIPLRMSVPVVERSTSRATISWTTNKLANGSISIGSIGSGGSPTLILDQVPTRHHRLTAEFLVAGLTYEYEVISTDEDGETVRYSGSFLAI